MNPARKAVSFLQWMRYFSTPADVMRYVRVAANHDRSGPAVCIRCRGLGGKPQVVRPGTTDARVLRDTFRGKYHLPPRGSIRRPDPVILDLGANVGYTTAHFSALYPRARVIAVELDGDNAALARRNTSAFPRCEVVQAAIWHENGHVNYGGAEEWGFAVTPSGTGRSAPAMTMESLMDSRGIERADFVKMDIEGAESTVVAAGSPWLARIDSIALEIHAPATLEGCTGVLAGAGFRVRTPEPGIVVGQR